VPVLVEHLSEQESTRSIFAAAGGGVAVSMKG
jgi:hypothetical protein